jgi:hypothetical protein
MVIVWALSWWYGAGWKARLLETRERLLASYDYFSIGLLARTLFSPFRQISAGKVNGPIGLKFRAFVDRLISRFIGAFVRMILIVVGISWLALQVVAGVLVLILWFAVPFLPLIGFIGLLSGWVPTWN